MKSKSSSTNTIKAVLLHNFAFILVLFIYQIIKYPVEFYSSFILIIIFSTLIISPLFYIGFLLLNFVLFKRFSGLIKYFIDYFIVLIILLGIIYSFESIINGGIQDKYYLASQYLLGIIYSFTLAIFNYIFVIKELENK